MNDDNHRFQRLRNIMIYNKQKRDNKNDEKESINPDETTEEISIVKQQLGNEEEEVVTQSKETSINVVLVKEEEEASCIKTNISMKNEMKTESVSTQTSNNEVKNEIFAIVKMRMEQFKRASLDDKVFSRNLSPLLRRLQQEHEELKAKASALQAKLDSYENHSTKKRKLATPNSESVGNLYTPPNKTITNSPNINISTNNLNARNLSRFNGIASFVNTSRRPPIQMVPPVQQILPNQHQEQRSANENLIMIGNNRNFYNNVNTHVVGTNQGVRMTNFQPNDIRMQPAFNITGAPAHNNLPILSNNPQLIPSNPMAWQIHRHQQQQQSQPLRMPVQLLPSHIQVSENQQHRKPMQIISTADPAYSNSISNSTHARSHLPRLKASISTSGNGIILTWDYETQEDPDKFKVECYQLFANQSKDGRVKVPTDISQWKKIGVVNALPLPMACTLTQISSGNIYHFTVVAVDVHGREGIHSNPCTIRLNVVS